MASQKNDRLVARTVDGSINHYSGQKCKGTAADKALADRLGGHGYNIISNSDQHEVYLRELRPMEHVVDDKGRHTVHFFGARRRKFGGDERSLVADAMSQPEPHPREHAVAQRRLETQLAQTENFRSYPAFQQRCQSTFGHEAPRRKGDVHNARYANELEPVRSRIAPKEDWGRRRGEVMTHSHSAPSIVLADPAASLSRAVREDARKEGSQRQTESAHFAPRMSLHTYALSMDNTPMGRELSAGQQYCSANRVENYDFSVSRKNNHYSAHDKLTRCDPFYMQPRQGITNNSVKYDIVSNERKWFKY